jgi:predicted GNAT family N-acyltransferase
MPDYEAHRVGDGATLPQAHAVRRAVFIDEQGVPEDVEMDGKDDEATHFVVYDADAGEPVGTARVRSLDAETAKVERVAVRPQHRGNGLGERLMDLAEDAAREQGHTRVRLHAQTAVESFYESLGYETVSDEFEEANIPHVEMQKRL